MSIKGYVRKNNPLTLEVPLGENTRVNSVISRVQAKGIYKLYSAILCMKLNKAIYGALPVMAALTVYL